MGTSHCGGTPAAASCSLNGVFGIGDAELFMVDTPLGEGAGDTLRAKFSLSQQRDLLTTLPEMLVDGTFNVGDLSRGEIHITGVRRVWSHRYWSEIQLSVEMPPKKPGDAPSKAAFAGIMVAHKFRPGASALIVVDPDHIALTKLYRFHAAYAETLPGKGKGWRLECPRGGFKPGETPAECALREASEEAGIRIDPSTGLKPGGSADQWDTRAISLGEVEPDSGILLSTVALFAITGAQIDRSAVKLDVTEAPTETVVLEVDRALEMIERGEITCSMTITSVMRALLKGIIRSKKLVLH